MLYGLARAIGNSLPFPPGLKLFVRNALLRRRHFRGSSRHFRGSRHFEDLRRGNNRPKIGSSAQAISPECCGLVPGMVSVVLPVYNQADLLRESVDSVLAQTYRDIELIIINDGSEDDIEEILQQYNGSTYGDNINARGDNISIRCYTQSNQGLPKALSNGFSLARGEFWCWTSADNLMQPKMLERLVEKLQAEPELGMVYADYYAIDECGQLLQDRRWRPLNRPDPSSGIVRLPRRTRDLNIVHDNFIGPCFLYRGWIGRTLGDYAPIMGIEDYDYWMRINAFFLVKHLGSDEPLYRYRVHSNSLSAKEDEMQTAAKTRQLMAQEKTRAAFFQSPLPVAMDNLGAHWLDCFDGDLNIKAQPSSDDREESTPYDLTLISSDTALKHAEGLTTLPATAPIAILFDYEDPRCQRLRHSRPLYNLLRRPGSVALVRDSLTARRVRLFTDCLLLDADAPQSPLVLAAFARNWHFFHRTWSAAELQRQMPRPLARSQQTEHILLQVDDFMQGGLENVVMDLAASLQADGLQVTIAVLGRRGRAAEEAEARGLPVQIFPSGLSPVDYVHWLKQKQVTLVNAHYSLFAARECKEAAIPFIETIHNAYVWLPPETIADYRQADDYISAYVCVSDTAAHYADIALGLNPGKMRIIPNGINIAAIGDDNHSPLEGLSTRSRLPTQQRRSPQLSRWGDNEKQIKENRARLRGEWNVPEDAPVILNVASIMATKAQLPLVRAFAAVLKDYPESRLVLLGSVMEPAYMESIVKVVEDLGLGEHVIFAGFHSDSTPFYQAADVFVLPSYWEGWSLSLAEAAVSGLPCVITDVGSAYEFADQPGVEIIPPPFGDIAELNYGNLRRYLYADDPKFTEALAAAMLRCTAATFSSTGNRRLFDRELAARFDRRRAYSRYADLFREYPRPVARGKRPTVDTKDRIGDNPRRLAL